MRDRLAAAMFLLVGLHPAAALAQMRTERLLGASSRARDLEFPAFTIRLPEGAACEIVNTVADRTHLVPMGEKDKETPPADCVSRL